MDPRQQRRSEEPQIASPIDQIDEDCGGFLQQTLDFIETSHPNFLAKLSPADREALLDLRNQCEEEVAREYQRTVEARRAYLRGFKSGVDSLMSGVNEEIASMCEAMIHPPPEANLVEIDICGDNDMMEKGAQMSADGVVLREPPQVQWGRHVADMRGDDQRPPATEPTLGANTTHIFWYPLRLVEFDCERRPLAWCANVHDDGMRQEIRDMSTAFHGQTLLWRTHEERLISQETVPMSDPRLPASFIAVGRAF